MKSESVADRIASYLPPPEILALGQPSVVETARRAVYRDKRPGDEYALVMHESKLVMVPAWHPLNQTSKAGNSAVYGTGSMETLSLEPVTAGKTEDNPSGIIGAGIVLLDPRMDRLFDRALPAREARLPIGREKLARGIIDLMAVLGTGVLVDVSGNTGIGSIRVTVGPGAGKFGKSAVDQEIDLSVEAYYGKPSFPESAYTGSGLVISAGPDQRFVQFRGKHSSHYGDGGRIGNIAKKLGADDAVFFAPYFAEDPGSIDYLPRYHGDRNELEKSMMRLALANGLGAEILAVRKDGTILLPPMNVNRLGGVTADYVMNYLAPDLGIATEIAPFNLEQVERGDITGLFFAGNAARIAGIGTVRLHDVSETIIKDIQLEIPSVIRVLIERFENEVSGGVLPSHATLITPVDLAVGREARQFLEAKFSGWI